MKRLSNFSAIVVATWAQLSSVERLSAGILLVALTTSLSWWIFVSPALRVMSTAPVTRQTLDAQLQQVLELQAQARKLQARPSLSRETVLRKLEAEVREALGDDAQVRAAGGDAVAINLSNVPADKLAKWLAQTRSNAHALPREAHLSRNAAGGPTSTTAANITNKPVRAGPPTWQGTVLMGLPAAR